MIDPGEVEPGLVVRFDPDALFDKGARTDRTPDKRVQGIHYFVCTMRIQGISVWVPTFSRWIPGRIRLGWKGGEAEWRLPPSYVDLTQQWLVPDCALGPASTTDRTPRWAHNRASLCFLLGRDDDQPSAA